MKTKIIAKESLKDLFKELVKEWNVYVPQRNAGGDAAFDLLPANDKELDKALRNIMLDGADTVISPKDIFFPQLESLFEFEKGRINETTEPSPKLLFGVTPCDLKGIKFCDEFYKRNLDDRYYLSRINNRFTVVIGCRKPPRHTCFCTSAKTGPFAEEGFDLQLIDNNDFYWVEAGSKEGEELTGKFKKYFKEAAKDADIIIAKIKSAAGQAIELKVDFEKALELMKKDGFIPEENYKRIGERCIYCGGCLYTCPTCTCFNVFDNTNGQRGMRLRNWDACIFEGYTREASGHNPRKEKWLRTARRYEHKLKYDYQVTGMSGCVGCGRCLSSCPVDIGISKFIQEITEERRSM